MPQKWRPLGPDGTPRRYTIEEQVGRVTRFLRTAVRARGLAAPDGIAGIRVGPDAPPFRARERTWSDARDLLGEWADAGHSWVNLRLGVTVEGVAYLYYQLPPRGEMPLRQGDAPDVVLSGGPPLGA